MLIIAVCQPIWLVSTCRELTFFWFNLSLWVGKYSSPNIGYFSYQNQIYLKTKCSRAPTWSMVSNIEYIFTSLLAVRMTWSRKRVVGHIYYSKTSRWGFAFNSGFISIICYKKTNKQTNKNKFNYQYKITQQSPSRSPCAVTGQWRCGDHLLVN